MPWFGFPGSAPASTDVRLVALAAVMGLATSGCRLPSWKSATESVATCRELSQQGRAAIENQDWGAAEKNFGQAIKACPVDPDARRYYSEALWNRGDQKQALAQLHEAIRLTPSDPALHLRLAELSIEMQDYDTAASEVTQALDLEPTLAAAWALRGKLMTRLGRTIQALADYHRALKYEPEHFEALFHVAELHRTLGQPRKALNALQELSDLYPPGEEPQEVLYLSGLAYLALGQHQDAVEILTQAAERGPESADIYFRLAEAEFLVGRAAAAGQAVQAALEIAPQHAESRALLERITAVNARDPSIRR